MKTQASASASNVSSKKQKTENNELQQWMEIIPTEVQGKIFDFFLQSRVIKHQRRIDTLRELFQAWDPPYAVSDVLSFDHARDLPEKISSWYNYLKHVYEMYGHGIVSLRKQRVIYNFNDGSDEDMEVLTLVIPDSETCWIGMYDAETYKQIALETYNPHMKGLENTRMEVVMSQAMSNFEFFMSDLGYDQERCKDSDYEIKKQLKQDSEHAKRYSYRRSFPEFRMLRSLLGV